MPDLREWLVVEIAADNANAFYDFGSLEEATMFLRSVIGEGKKAQIYQHVPFTVNVDVTVQAPRKRRRKESKDEAATPNASESPDQGVAPATETVPPPSPVVATAGTNPASLLSLTPSTERAATPRAEEPTTKDAAAQEPAVSPVVASAEPTASLISPDAEGIDPSPADSLAFAGSNPASATNLFVCEASFPSDAACPGPAEFDPVTRGRFCSFHLVQVPEGHRREMHRIHGHRNRPHEAVVRLAG